MDSPSPHKFGLSLIRWHIVFVRICGERGANDSRYTPRKTLV